MVEENKELDAKGSIQDHMNQDLSMKEGGSDNPSVQALADHLMSIARHERMVESERIRLNEIPYFMPEAVLRHLSKLTMKRPVAEDILDFLTKVGFTVDLSDAKALIHVYDSDKDGQLHNTELRNFLVSATQAVLRDRFSKVPLVQPVGDTLSLGSGPTVQLAQLMMTEIYGLRKLERDRAYLVCGRQLSAVVAFSMIKTSETNELTKSDILQFLSKNGYQPTSDDIDSLFWRLDHNKDGRLAYSDFCQIYDDSALATIIPQSSRQSSMIQDFSPTQSHSKSGSAAKQLSKKKSTTSVKSSTSSLKLDHSKISSVAAKSIVNEEIKIPSSRTSKRSTSSKGKLSNKKVSSKKLASSTPKNSGKIEIPRPPSASSSHKSKPSSSVVVIPPLKIGTQGAKQDKPEQIEKTPTPSKPIDNTVFKRGAPEASTMVFKDTNQADYQLVDVARKLNLDSGAGNNGSSSQRFGVIQNQTDRTNKSNQNEKVPEEEHKFTIQNNNQNNSTHLRDKRGSQIFELAQPQMPLTGPQSAAHLKPPILRKLPVPSTKNQPQAGIKLVDFLKRAVSLEIMIEKAKNELALLYDFTFEEGFKTLDILSKQEVLAEDMLHCMQSIFGVTSFNIKEITLFMQRFDKFQGKRLKLLDFSNAFTPREPVFAEYVKKKSAQFPDKQPLMSKETHLKFRDLLVLMIDNEVKLELLRHELFQSPYFSAKVAFCNFDTEEPQNCGDEQQMNQSLRSSHSRMSSQSCLSSTSHSQAFITRNGLHLYLRNNGFVPTERELEALFSVMDRDRDGRVTYSEFLNFVTPQIQTQTPKKPERQPYQFILMKPQDISEQQQDDQINIKTSSAVADV